MTVRENDYGMFELVDEKKGNQVIARSTHPEVLKEIADGYDEYLLSVAGDDGMAGGE